MPVATPSNCAPPPVNVGHLRVIDVDELQGEARSLAARVEALEATVAHQERAIDARIYALRCADGRVDSLRVEAAALRAEVSKLEATDDERLAVISSQENALRDGDAHRGRLQETTAKLRDRLEALTSEVSTVQGRAEEAEEVAVALRAQVSRLEGEVVELRRGEGPSGVGAPDPAVGAAVGQEGVANMDPGTVAGAPLDAGASHVVADAPTAESSTAPAAQPAPVVGPGYMALVRNLRELRASFDALVRDSRNREQRETGRRVLAEAEVDRLRGLLARHRIETPGPRGGTRGRGRGRRGR